MQHAGPKDVVFPTYSNVGRAICSHCLKDDFSEAGDKGKCALPLTCAFCERLVLACRLLFPPQESVFAIGGTTTVQGN